MLVKFIALNRPIIEIFKKVRIKLHIIVDLLLALSHAIAGHRGWVEVEEGVKGINGNGKIIQ